MKVHVRQHFKIAFINEIRGDVTGARKSYFFSFTHFPFPIKSLFLISYILLSFLLIASFPFPSFESISLSALHSSPIFSLVPPFDSVPVKP